MSNDTDAIWCIADCNLSLRQSIGNQSTDALSTLGLAALLTTFVRPTQYDVNDEAHRLAHQISTALALDPAQHAKLNDLLASHQPSTAVPSNGSTPPTNDVAESQRQPGVWQQVAALLRRMQGAMPGLDKTGDIIRKYDDDARRLWTLVLPIIMSGVTLVGGTLRTFVYGNERPDASDGGIGDTLVGGSVDIFTVILTVVMVATTILLIVSARARAFLSRRRAGIALLALLYIVFLLALVRATLWGFEEPYRWVATT